MFEFIKNITDNKKIVFIDNKIFNHEHIIKASYQFLDSAYFYLCKNNDVFELQISKKTDKDNNLIEIIGDFSDELLSVYLRDLKEKNNKNIRESIVNASISNCLDLNNFVSIDPKTKAPIFNKISDNDEEKNIDDLLKDIGEDPEMQIDKEEIAKILKEIEEDEKK